MAPDPQTLATADTDATELARRLIDAINDREIDTVSALLAPDYRAEWPDAALDLAASFEREIQMMTGLPDTRFGIDRATRLDDGRVLVEATVTGTHTGPLSLPHGVELAATGRRISIQFVLLMRFVNGLLAEERLFFDHHELIHQLTRSE